MNNISDRPTTNTGADHELAQLVEQITARIHAGEQIDSAIIAQDFPDHADRLIQLLPTLRLLGTASQPGNVIGAWPSHDALEREPLGDFQIIREVGRGGMGVVYEATQLSLNRRVALKVLPFAATMDSRHLQRFRNEAQAAACLHHPNIVPVYGVGCERGVHYYAMQLIAGITLANVVEEFREPKENDQSRMTNGQGTIDHQSRSGRHAPKIGLPETRSLGRDVTSNILSSLDISHSASKRNQYYRRIAHVIAHAADALEYAHSMGVVHRDIKPGNLLLDDTGHLWVTDFGLAKLEANANMTMTGDLIGTLKYMSPEQALARHGLVDHRTDVYSLGATLYELLTLRPAVDGADKQEILKKIAFEEPVALRKIDRSIPVELETITLKCLAKNPSERYATAKELAVDLRSWLEEKPITAKPPGLGERCRKWVRRHKTLARMSVAILVVTVIGLGVGTWLIWREKENARLAKVEAESAKVQAETRAAESKAILDFLEDKIFKAAQPENTKGGLGHDVTLRNALMFALPYIEKNFADQPLIEARLRTTMGNTFSKLGDETRAVEQLERARALLILHLGPEHPDTLRSGNTLSLSYSNLNRMAEALTLREETLSVMKRVLPQNHLDTLAVKANLANSYFALHRRAEALSLREETYESMKRVLPPDHFGTLQIMCGLAESYFEENRVDEALRLYEAALAAMRKTLPLYHSNTLYCMDALAKRYEDLDRQSEALALKEETLAARKKLLPHHHRETLSNMTRLAGSYYALDRVDEAIALLEETVTAQKHVFPSDDPDLLLSKTNLASCYMGVKRLEKACKLFEETLPTMKSKMPNDLNTFICICNLGRCYYNMDRKAEALKIYEETLANQKRVLRRDHPLTLHITGNLAQIYHDLNRHDDALVLRKATLAAAKRVLPPDHPDALIYMCSLAESYAALNRPGEALPVFDELLAKMDKPGVNTVLFPNAMYGRVQCCKKLGDLSGCRASIDMMERRKPTDGEGLYAAACIRALTAVLQAKTPGADAERLAKEDADKAMAWLTKAVAAGYKNVAHMKKDEDLTILREREDFRKLVAELEAKTKQ